MSDVTPPEPPEPSDPAIGSEVPVSEPAAAPDAGGEPTGEFAEFFHTEDLPARPRQSHRGAVEMSPSLQRLLAPATAVVVVVIVVLLLIWINGSSSGDGINAAADGPVPHHTHTGALPGGSGQPTTAPTHRRPTPTTPPTSTPPTHASKPPATKTTSPAITTAKAPVTVLNNSRRTGLAASVAAELRARHWTVVSTGNQQTVIPVTTLYYPAGQHAAAVHLAHLFPSIQRIAPSGGTVHGGNLTLVVTGSWAL